MDNMDPKTHKLLTVVQNVAWLLAYVVLFTNNKGSQMLVSVSLLTIIVALNTWSHLHLYTHHSIAPKARVILIINMVLAYILLYFDASTFELLFLFILIGDVIYGNSTRFSIVYTAVTIVFLIPYYIYTYNYLPVTYYDVSILRDVFTGSSLLVIMYVSKYLMGAVSQNKILLESRDEAYQRLEQYSRKLESMATAEERSRMALILHNSLGHSLISIMLSLQAEKRELVSQGQLEPEAFSSLEVQIKEAMAMLRKTVSGVDYFFDEIDFDDMMDMLVGNAQNNTKVMVEYSHKGTEKIPRSLNSSLFNLIQEAMTNAMKHGKCSLIELDIHVLDTILIQVKDNGIGASKISYGFGMKKSSEMVEALNGSYEILNEEGFVVKIKLPLKEVK